MSDEVPSLGWRVSSGTQAGLDIRSWSAPDSCCNLGSSPHIYTDSEFGVSKDLCPDTASRSQKGGSTPLVVFKDARLPRDISSNELVFTARSTLTPSFRFNMTGRLLCVCCCVCCCVLLCVAVAVVVVGLYVVCCVLLLCVCVFLCVLVCSCVLLCVVVCCCCVACCCVACCVLCVVRLLVVSVGCAFVGCVSVGCVFVGCGCVDYSHRIITIREGD